jgi:hypothetical protein
MDSSHKNRGCVAALAALALASTIWAGCGDSSPQSARSEERAAQLAFIKEADRFCEKERRERFRHARAYEAKLGPDPPGDWLQIMTVRVILPAIRRQVKVVGAMPVPASQESSLDTLVAAMERAVHEARRDPAHAFTSGNPFERPARIAHHLGFKVCAIE